MLKAAPAPAGERLVLVVEHDDVLLRTLGRVLVRPDTQVTLCAEAREGLARMAAQRFDAVVSDLLMPRMNGLEFLRALRDHDADVQTILITAGSAVDSVSTALAYGALRCVLKPFHLRDLLAAVDHAIQATHYARSARERADPPNSRVFTAGPLPVR